MYFKSKSIQLLILGITAIVCSRVMFSFFNDLEGPNLLVVSVMAVVIYFISVAIYLLNPKGSFQNSPTSTSFGIKRLFAAIFIQIIVFVTFYFLFG